MDRERWRQIDSLLLAALEHEPAERAAFLDQASGADESLKKEVELLLSRDDRCLSFIDSTAIEVAADLLLTPVAQLVEGQLFGHYTIIEFLGAGGMGEVYLAKDEKLNRRIALKLLPVEYTRHKNRMHRFKQEAQAASALNHPNILTIHELGKVGRQQYIATEFVEGETLRQRMNTSTLNLSEVLDIAFQVASALAAAHRAGIVHRDIKPENIMLRPDGYVKVLDFGLAKLTEQSESFIETHCVDDVGTSSGLVMGTVKYMSPEQARGSSVDRRSDIFSFGVVLHEMIAGQLPFKGNNVKGLIQSTLNNSPPKLKEVLPDAPAALQEIVDKTLEKNREKRYQSANELLIDLSLLRQEVDPETGLKYATNELVGSRVLGRQAKGNTVSAKLLGTGTANSSIQYLVSQIEQHKPVALFGVLVLVVVLGSVIYPLKRLISKNAAPFEHINVVRLSASGSVQHAALSPDGNYVAYTTWDADGLETLWIRPLMTQEATQLIAPREVITRKLIFSRDSKSIYYIIVSGELYRVPAVGGPSEKILNDVGAFITFSPEGDRFAFIRREAEGLTALVMVNSDGSGERTVATRKPPDYFSQIEASWAPDGKSIACIGINAADGYQRVFEVNTETGSQKALTSQRWNDEITGVAWLQDSSGILLIASDSPFSSQIWCLSYTGGELRRITNDVNKYATLSPSNDSSTFLTLQWAVNIDLWIAPDGDSNRVRQLTRGRYDGRSGITWTPDDRIVYTSVTSTNSDIWIMNADGTNQKQLTTDVHNDVYPSVTADGRYIVFQSNRTGSDHIWRMDIDGNNQKQLTFGVTEKSPNCSPDSKWVIFEASDSGKTTIWKASIDGDPPAQILNTECFWPAVSPDGKLIACYQFPNRSLIFPFEGGKQMKQLDLPVAGGPAGFPVWTRDGLALTYTHSRGLLYDFFNKPIDGGPSKQLSNFTKDQAGATYGVLPYAWSPDGKNLAYARYERKSDMLLISAVK